MANYEKRFDATGVREQVEPGAKGVVVEYGTGFWQHQWFGFRGASTRMSEPVANGRGLLWTVRQRIQSFQSMTRLLSPAHS